MPSAMVGNTPVQSAFPDVGNGSHTETMKHVLGVIEKKVRNMEKKKSKLDDYQAKKDKGEKLNQDQLEALSKYQEINNNLDFARELQKSFLSLGQEIQKAVKKSARREQLQREEVEQRRLKAVLELQYLLDQLGEESIRQDLKHFDASGSSLLTDAELASLDEFYKLLGPERNYEIKLSDQYEEASLHLWELLEGRDKAVAGTTYKLLKDTLDKVLVSGYFDKAPTHQNGACEEEEEAQEEQSAVAVAAVVAEQQSEPEGLTSENYTEAVDVETTEFVNRQFIPETSYSNTDNDQAEEWTVEAQMVSGFQHQPPAQLSPEPVVAVNQVAPRPANDPVVRKQAVQDLMAQMQGTYNFMQDSMLEFDGQALDPAIVSAQPMKPLQTVDLQQIGASSLHSESRLSQTTTVPGAQEPSQSSMSLSSEQSPVPSSLSTVSKSTPTGGINVNATPFQSVHAVFNLNAPIPPSSDGQADTLKQPTQFTSGFGQSYSGQSENEQPDISQERLQSVVGGFQPQDQVLSSAGVHENSSAAAGFGQSGQSFYNSRAASRGGPRNARGMMNGYRGSSNGFRGGYEGYRPPFTNAPANSTYGQTQFSTSRDYSSSSYQREGYQQGYKRGGAQGPRGLSRGNSQAMRS